MLRRPIETIRVIGNWQVYFADETDIDCLCIEKNRYS